ncbi:MraY family glycosyltransferase [Prevotella sp.]
MSIYTLISLFAFAMSAVCGFIIIPQILSFCKKRKLYDTPDARKIHNSAVPRLGGVSFIPSMLIATIVALLAWTYTSKGSKIGVSPWSIFFGVGVTIIYITGVLDDIFGMRAKLKLLMQIVAACLLPISYLYINNFYGFLGIYEIPAIIGMILTVGVLVFIMNAINLIDGIDGLSASLTLIALSGLFYIFQREQIWVYCILIAGLMGVLIPFLYHNLWGKQEKNQKIFMGDSGSLTIGYILGVLLIKFCMHNPRVMPYQKGATLLSVTLLLVATFDVFRVIIVRILHRKPLFKADKNHIHHKLMRAGLSQHQALISIITLSIIFIIINLSLFNQLLVTWIIAIDIIIYIAFHHTLNFFIRRRGALPFTE